MTTSMSDVAPISSVPELKACLSSISSSSTLYLDLEGERLSRHGSISLITLLIYPQKTVRLIDVLALGKQTFTTASINGTTLQIILEDPAIPKCAWDIRNDADALWAHYRVGLAGVTDIQLLENASRTGGRTYVHGLDKAIQFDLRLGFMEASRWVRKKKEIQRLMSANIFTARPMDPQTIQYCVDDVLHLPELYMVYLGRIQEHWLAKVIEESACRVAEVRSPRYDPQSPLKKLGPWGA